MTRIPFCSEGRVSSTFHQRGLASTLQRTHLLPDLFLMGADSVSSSSFTTSPAFERRPRADVGVCATTVDVRRLLWAEAGTGGTTTRVDWSTRLALRAVPVRVRSACLNSLANNWRAVMSVPSTSSYIGWTMVFGVWSLHQIAASIVPVSPLRVTVGTVSRRVALTGVISKPKV